MATQTDKKVFQLELSEDDFTCKICSEIMLDPKVLPCAHRLCEYCINSMIASESKLNCPYCRQTFSFDFRTDIFLKDIINQMKIDLPCGNKLPGKNVESHRITCLECLKSEFTKIKNTHDTLLEKRKKKPNIMNRTANIYPGGMTQLFGSLIPGFESRNMFD